MNQSGVLVSALAGGFVLYLAAQGKLGAYWSLLTGGGGSTTTASPTTSTLPGTAPGNTGAGGTLVQPQGPNSLVPGAGIQITPGMQGN
jgi:hypothetical protein